MKKLITMFTLSVFLFSCEEYSYLPDATLKGSWNAVSSVDSLVWIFEGGSWREYIYQRGTNNILDRIDHGGYWLVDYGDGETYIKTYGREGDSLVTYLDRYYQYSYKEFSCHGYRFTKNPN